MSSRPSGARRSALGLLATTGLLTGALAAVPTAASAAPGAAPVTPGQAGAAAQRAVPKAGADVLGRGDREKLTAARAQGKRSVTVMVVTERGREASVQRELRGLGATVRYTSSRLGYFSAVVPVDQVDRAAKLLDVLAVDLDEQVPLPDERVTTPAAARGNLTAPDATTPESNPFMPTAETGSNAFRDAHPTWDGRGTTIGVLDTGIDLAHPALQTTTTGERKVVDWFTATDPVTEGSLVPGGDATWLPMTTDARGGSATYDGATWKLPAGTYKIATFVEAGTLVAGCEVCGDVNRDGDTTDRFGVLYNPQTHAVRVDSDQDRDFTDDQAMRPYREARQVGTFGTDKPFTDVREAMAFTVDYREDQDLAPLDREGVVDFVDIGIVSGEHGSHVAGITAARDMFGGKMDGQAPGAKLVSARACAFGPGCTAAALTDGMAELATRGVDVINMSIGGLPALNDADNARAELYDRIIADGVQIVLSGGNSGNALNTIGDPAVASNAISVGASISEATWKANYGADVAFAGSDRGMMTFSSGGPREDGGFKPNVTAPGSAISTIPTWQPGGPVAEAGYGLPAGYAMLNGTSMAAPQTAGAVSLLLSAAKQTGKGRVPTAALRRALYSSADFDPTVPAFLQGNGQVDTPGAWALLSTGITADAFTVSAPVCTTIWQLLGRTSGTGVYDRCDPSRGGAVAGRQHSYPITITRTSGPAAPGPYRLSLLGDDGTFRLEADTVRLPLGKKVTVSVTSTPAAGAHSAVLRLDAASTPGVDTEVMMAVVASPALTAPAYGTTVSGTALRAQAQRYYVTVPQGAKALQVQLSGLAAGSQTRFLAFHPYGLPLEEGSSLVCYSNFSDPSCDPASRVYTDPTPGVWELLVESRRTTPLQSNPFTLTATVLGATVTPATQTIDSVQAGVATPVEFAVRNDFGTVTATATGGPLGSALADRPSVANGKRLVRTVEVPAGATRLDVSIGRTSDTGADLDLTVSGPSGTLSSADGDSEEAVSFPSPKPGTYTVAVDGYAVPAGTTAFDYLDVFFSPALGSLTVPAGTFTLTSGETRTITGTLTAQQGVAPGRSLFGAADVVTTSGATLGRATVVVGSVTG